MDDAYHSAGESARQAIIDKIDCHDALREKAIRGLGTSWKEAPLSKLREFLATHLIEE